MIRKVTLGLPLLRQVRINPQVRQFQRQPPRQSVRLRTGLWTLSPMTFLSDWRALIARSGADERTLDRRAL